MSATGLAPDRTLAIARRGLACLAIGAAAVGLAACASLAAATPTPRGPAPRGEPARLTPAPGVPGNAERGRALFVAQGCAGCHTVRGVAARPSLVGPNLTNVALRPTLAPEAVPNSPENMVRWIMDPPATKPGTAMPKLFVSEADARDLTAFLYSQPYNPRN
jgi:cytochrome c1